MARSRRDIILATVGDLVSSLLYYDRKEDDELRVGEIEEAVRLGEITCDEIITVLRDGINRATE